MTPNSNAGKSNLCGLRQFGLVMLILIGLLLFLFRDGLRPEMTVFSNDGPLGQVSSTSADTWAARDGAWLDLNWLGTAGIAAVPSFTNLLSLAVGKLYFSKLYALFSLLFVGFGAWFCFRQWKFTPLTCILGGIAAALNGDFLPTACWGVCAQPIAFGLNYIALGFLADTTSPRRWVRVVLAGFAVGMGVMEAFDIGGIFSLFTAAFVVFQAYFGEGSNGQKAVRGFSRLAIVAGCAGVIAYGAISTLISTQVENVGGMAQDSETKAQRWDQATEWSFPKRETLGIVVPGLFGLRMSPPPTDGSHYWGAIGRHPSWDRWFKNQNPEDPPGGFMRYGGGSGYAGALVVVLALWAVIQSFRKQGSPFSVYQRRMIWFWLGMMFVALLMAYGRFTQIGGFSGIYGIFYALPYASMIRNPAKFLHVAEWAGLILFGFGLDALSRTYMQVGVTTSQALADQWKTWRAKAVGFDRLWFKGSLVVLAGGVVAWVVYGASSDKLIAYLKTVGFDHPTLARDIASYSVRQVGWALVLYTIALGLVVLVIAGCFNGRRARLGGVLLGAFLAIDLAMYAGLMTGPSAKWIVTYNWKQRLDSNPIIDLLRKDAYLHRVTIVPLDPDRFPPQMKQIADQYKNLSAMYGYDWKQHVFPYYDIPVADVVQEPRMGTDKMAYLVGTSGGGQVRQWELNGSSYFLGPSAIFPILNQQFDAQRQRFRILARFDLTPKPGLTSAASGDDITTVLNTNGQYAVFEFTGALPRARLYTNWQVATNDPAALKAWMQNFEKRVPGEFYSALAGLSANDLATLKQLGDPSFDPTQTVLLSGENPLPPPTNAATNQNAGTVEFTSYSPKRIVLHAKATAPAVLLLNDRYNPGWTVTVDGKPVPLIRANFIVRAVAVPAGDHKIEFYFATNARPSQVSFVTILVGIVLIGFLAVTSKRDGQCAATPAPAPKPAKK